MTWKSIGNGPGTAVHILFSLGLAYQLLIYELFASHRFLLSMNTAVRTERCGFTWTEEAQGSFFPRYLSGCADPCLARSGMIARYAV